MRQVLVLLGALLVIALVVPASLADTGNGNAPNAKACQQSGWENLFTRDGHAFTGDGACTSYGAQGGRILTQAALDCLSGGWSNLGATSSTAFASEQACVDFVLGGGTPARVGADLSLSVTFLSPSKALLIVTNSGPSTATHVTVRIPLPACCGGGFFPYGAGWTPFVHGIAFGLPFVNDVSNPSVPVGSSTVVTVLAFSTPGTSTTWTADVYASDQPDPDSTPNNGITTEDDYVTFTVHS